jgi:hypothetical protein
MTFPADRSIYDKKVVVFMAESVQTVAPENQKFRTQPKSIVGALAFFVGGVVAFTLGITHVYFVEAMAWTFTIWGALLMYNHLSDYATRYEITEDSLVILTPFIFWRPKRVWSWAQINRMDVIVGQVEAELEDVTMQVYHVAKGSTVINREDIAYDPELARIIAERAGLKAARGQAMQSFDKIPQDAKATYKWQ